MKLKRVLSLLLTMVIMLTLSIEAFAINLNMNVDGETIEQVQTGTEQFFNVKFAPKEYEPNAEQVYYLFTGRNYDMWRYSGDQDKTKDGMQPWRTPWGTLSDLEMQDLMDGKNPDAFVYLNEQLPDGVLNFLNNGGSWDDIKVTFQCEDVDGNRFESDQLFLNGAVDCWIKWGTEVQLAFKPYFRGSGDLISNDTAMQVNRGLYPYSHTMFSMFTKGGGHKGATMVHDVENGEPKDKYTSQGFDSLYFDDILNTRGDLKEGKNLKNLAVYCTNCKSYHPEGIPTDTVRIGDGSTFNSGGAIGVSFHFPVKITFEINPQVQAKDEQIYLRKHV